MLSTPFTCCSIGVATACSRVFASAPTNVACNLISGGTMLGNCATGRLVMVTAPTITIRMEITIATIGRSMKNFDIAQFPSPEECAGFGVTRVPSLSFCNPSTTTWSPGLRPSSITHIVPTVSPGFTARILTL